MRIVEKILLDNSMADWALAFGILVGVSILLWLLKGVVIRRFVAYASHTASEIDDVAASVLGTTHFRLLAPLAVYLAAEVLNLPERTQHIIGQVTVIALLLQVAIWGYRFIDCWMQRTLRTRKDGDASSTSNVAVLGFLMRLALWVVALLLTLDNLGFNITALLTGLGIGGIAVALAAQNILGDLFASMSIVLDKPFVIGDFIVVGELMGTVEYIGLKTTRVRSLSGEQIIFANSDLLNSRIRNYKRMQQRRVAFTLGVVYQTSPELLARIPGMVREIIEAQPTTRFDRAHFKEFGDSALIFEAVYFVLDQDYNVYMDIHQEVLLAIFLGLNARGIDFAYPTQTVIIAKSQLNVAG